MINNDRTKTLHIKSEHNITCDEKRLCDGSVIGYSTYNDQSENPSSPLSVSHKINKFESEIDETHGFHNITIDIEFLDSKSGDKALKSFDFTKNHPNLGGRSIDIVSVHGVICGVNIAFHNNNKIAIAAPYEDFDIEKVFVGIDDDNVALTLCGKFFDHVEVITDNDGSWVQIIDGTEEEDILYSFKENFGNNDGVFNLFKMLNIKAKSV